MIERVGCRGEDDFHAADGVEDRAPQVAIVRLTEAVGTMCGRTVGHDGLPT